MAKRTAAALILYTFKRPARRMRRRNISETFQRWQSSAGVRNADSLEELPGGFDANVGMTGNKCPHQAAEAKKSGADLQRVDQVLIAQMHFSG